MVDFATAGILLITFILGYLLGFAAGQASGAKDALEKAYVEEGEEDE